VNNNAKNPDKNKAIIAVLLVFKRDDIKTKIVTVMKNVDIKNKE
jgi:hypothetical protein